METKLDLCLRGSVKSQVAREFFTNSGHFPIALIALEMLINGPWAYLAEVDFYLLLLGAGLQAGWLGLRAFRGQPTPLLGNLIGPLLYTAGEITLELHEYGLWEGVRHFFAAPHHSAYWIFALLIGGLQSLRIRFPEWGEAVVLLENLARSLMLLVMYGIFESLSDPGEVYSLAGFFRDDSHVFIGLVLFFSGILLGFAHLNSERLLALLRETHLQLQTYSTWFLGEDQLRAAVNDPTTLRLQRRERCVLFMDIRGFTGWSERQAPEQVVAMLDQYFTTAEDCWNAGNTRDQISKIKFTGDEILLVFAQAAPALATARCLRAQIQAVLRPHGLGAGIGLHQGPLMEGMMGCREIRGYDIIGDTVNTAKRICDHAGSGEILLSRATLGQISPRPAIAETRRVKVKGKNDPLELVALASEEEPFNDRR